MRMREEEEEAGEETVRVRGPVLVLSNHADA